MPRILNADRLARITADVGEGPLWNVDSGWLSFVDIPRGRIHLCAEDGTLIGTHQLDRFVGAALPAASGGFLVADAEGFSRLAADGTCTPLLPFLAAREDLRLNDAKTDRAGRAFAGSMAYDKTAGAGSLYRLEPGPAVSKVFTGLTVSNGLGWSPDDAIFWFADSAVSQIAGFDYDIASGTVGAIRHRFALQDTGDVPDGFCIDDEGCIWLALWGGWAIHRYTPAGVLDTIVKLPVRNVTSCAFGGADGATLFITTARRGLSDGELRAQPEAGDLFALRPGVGGAAATPWCDHGSVPSIASQKNRKF